MLCNYSNASIKHSRFYYIINITENPEYIIEHTSLDDSKSQQFLHMNKNKDKFVSIDLKRYKDHVFTNMKINHFLQTIFVLYP